MEKFSRVFFRSLYFSQKLWRGISGVLSDTCRTHAYMHTLICGTLAGYRLEGPAIPNILHGYVLWYQKLEKWHPKCTKCRHFKTFQAANNPKKNTHTHKKKKKTANRRQDTSTLSGFQLFWAKRVDNCLPHAESSVIKSENGALDVQQLWWKPAVSSSARNTFHFCKPARTYLHMSFQGCSGLQPTQIIWEMVSWVNPLSISPGKTCF